MKILIADKLAPFVTSELVGLGAEPSVNPQLAGAELVSEIAHFSPEVLVVRSTKVPKEALQAAPSLSLVIRAGAGVNTIDLEAASRLGIYVANCPGKNASAVAELTVGHLVNLDRRIADNVEDLRQGKWKKKFYGAAPGLRGRTLAVIGTGTIGQLVIGHARSLGMRVVAWSRSLTRERASELGVEYRETPLLAVQEADAVSVHLALTPETRGMMNSELFAAMKTGAYFINTSRGEIVDEDALLRSLDEKNIKAGLDVLCNEPSDGEISGPLCAHPNVYGTHHIGASTSEASDAVAAEVVRIIAAYKRGEPTPNCVNLAAETEATHVIVVRHADEVGILADVLNVLKEAGHNVQEISNSLFDGSAAACARIAVEGAPESRVMDALAKRPHVFFVSCAKRPEGLETSAQ